MMQLMMKLGKKWRVLMIHIRTEKSLGTKRKDATHDKNKKHRRDRNQK